MRINRNTLFPNTRLGFTTAAATVVFIGLGSLGSYAGDNTASDSHLPIKHVTLYTSGVGYFERSGSVEGDVSETLLFPVDQVNDVLKSLVLLDFGGGQVRPVTYAAQDPIDKQLHAFSIDVSDNPSRGALLNRLRGAEASITLSAAPAETITGAIIGVESQTITLPNNGGVVQQEQLNLYNDTGMHTIKLSDIASIKLNDPKLNQELKEALSVVSSGRDTSKRPVTISFSGKGKRDVLVGYLTASPLWQTTYRLVLGNKPMLQGWALVQNTSQDDWNDVTLNLVSGRPISFIQDLYKPYYVNRPVLQARVDESITPYAAPGGGMAGDEAEKAPVETATYAAPVMPAMPPTSRAAKSAHGISIDGGLTINGAPNFQAVKAAGARLGTSLFQYQIKIPVTVPRQQSAMIPFISSNVKAELVSVYNRNIHAECPLSGARIVNNSGLHLMGGPLTVFNENGDGTGYVGDALIDDTEPNQTRLITYALDLAVDAETAYDNDNSSEKITSVSINKGVLTVRTKELSGTRYTFTNHSDKPRTIVVEHPYAGDDWKYLEPAKVTEHTPTLDRFDLAIAAHETKSLKVKQARTVSSLVALMDTDTDQIAVYIKEGHLSDPIKEGLQGVIERRQRLADINNQINNKKARLADISAGQTRIRDNMKALDHASALYKRYTNELNDQETKIGEINSDIDRLNGLKQKAQNELSDYINNLTIGNN